MLNELANLIGNLFNQPQQSNVRPGTAQNAARLGASANDVARAAQSSMVNAALPQLAYGSMLNAAQQGGVPLGQSLSPQDIGRLSPQLRPLAQIYNQNPMDPRVAHMDPAIFGYAADNTANPGQLSGSFGQQSPNSIQGGQFNPGLIPLQGSRGAGTGAFGLQGGSEQQLQNGRSPQNNIVPWS